MVHDTEWTPYWLLESRSLDGRSLIAETALPGNVDLNPAVSLAPVTLADRVAMVIGFRVVVFDAAMSIAGWSGIIPAMPSRGGPDALVSTETGLLSLWLVAPEDGTAFDLWAAGFDGSGALAVPPHLVREALLDYGCPANIVATARGSSVVAATVIGTSGDCFHLSAVVLETDAWGNLRSEAVGAPFAEAVASGGGRFTVLADDEGWSVWAITEGGFPSILFQRVVPDVP
jgi:hypothetical protein